MLANNNPLLKPYLYDFPSIESFRKKARERVTDFQYRDQLKAAIKNSSSGLELSAAQQNNLELLGEKNTLTVCTGHQACFLGGPLYFVYKALHTIKLAQELNEKLDGFKVVPIFWLAGEDHDFDEIAQITVFGKKKALSNPDNLVPVGEIDKSVFEELKSFALSFFEGWESEAEIKAWLEEAWGNSNTL
ncbi:MAG: bacillithiol biosynthesis protein BshC, partial [Luteibaculum sp.]